MRLLATLLIGTAALRLATQGAAHAQTFALDPASSSLAAIPAAASDLLTPAPSIGIGAAALGLLPGDVVDAVSFGDDGPAGGTLFFSVTRASVGVLPGPTPPDVWGEVAAVPVGNQPEAAGDLFTAFDAAMLSPTPHTQILDGNGIAIGPTSNYAVRGLGLAELLPLPGPPFNDDLSAFEWSAPGRYPLTCAGVSLAPGSPSLVPGANPRLLAGAEPGDILVSCPGAPLLVYGGGVAGLGLISGGPGCAPPACDDVDALSISALGAVLYSLAPGSPSLATCSFSPADVLGGVVPPMAACPPRFAAAAVLGLKVTDDVDALEVVTNACPLIPPPADVADVDGFDPFCDNCDAVFNPDQNDSDGDTVGDACDPCTDTDGDGFGNPGFPASTCAVDLCPFTSGTNLDPDGDGLADECDNCPALANASQADDDADGTGDVCDACPHVAGATPLPLTGIRRVLAIYGPTGPGGGDDKPKLIRAELATGAAFDPDSTDDVHVTLRDYATGATMFAASLNAASGLWSQPKPANRLWKYGDPAAAGGVRKALLKEKPPASGAYQLKLVGKSADIDGPLVGPGILAIVEIATAGTGECFSAVNATCTSTPAKDKCDP